LKIYKVRFLDVVGKEVAEFGFYESPDDARRRALEVSKLVKSPGTMDIRAISVIPSSVKVAEKSGMSLEEALGYYELKEEANENA